MTKKRKCIYRQEEKRQGSFMKTEEAIIQIYNACKELCPELNPREHVSDLVYNILADLEHEKKKITPKKIEMKIREHAIFAQKCVRKKRKAA